MAFPLIIKPEAEDDLSDAYHWYEKQRSGLGFEFLQSVEDVFERISEAPEHRAVVYKTVRQAIVKRFPYVVCYTFESSTVYVFAVLHGHRDPSDWQSRT